MNNSNVKISRCVALLSVMLFVCSIFGAASTAAIQSHSERPNTALAFTTALEPVATGLSSSVYLTNAHDGTNRLFIVEQAGVIKVLQPGSMTPTVFLDISPKVLSGGERGLLGLAFHPQFQTNRRFFVNYTRMGDGATVVAEYHSSASNADIADTSEIIMITISQPFDNHNGGMIEFGGDGFLYIGMGDGGSANDPGNRSQNINELLGKILRIDIDHPNGPVPYSSPSDNPFFGDTAGLDEIYALGFRNPFRFSFDRTTGSLYVGDVGQAAWEEIDIVNKGENYGWRVMEGTHCNPDLNGGVCTPIGTAPIAEYAHTTGGRCSITGGYVYRGVMSTLPVGAYVFGDFCTGEIMLLQGGMQSLLLDTALNISSFGEDEAHELYVVGLGGTVYRIGIQAGPGGTHTVGLFNAAPSQLFLRNTNSAGPGDVAFGYGPAGAEWIPIVGDWNGNGVDTVGLYNPATSFFFLKNTHVAGAADLTFPYGPAGSGWIPLAGDWDGDSIDTVGLYNPTTSTFFLKNTNSPGSADLVFVYGPAGTGWIPLVGDWNGDGVDTVGLYNPSTSTFFLKNTNSAGPGDLVFVYGPAGAGWTPLVGDWDGNGTETVGLFDSATNTFFLKNTNSAGPGDLVFVYGPAGAGWTPIVAPNKIGPVILGVV